MRFIRRGFVAWLLWPAEIAVACPGCGDTIASVAPTLLLLAQVYCALLAGSAAIRQLWAGKIPVEWPARARARATVLQAMSLLVFPVLLLGAAVANSNFHGGPRINFTPIGLALLTLWPVAAFLYWRRVLRAPALLNCLARPCWSAPSTLFFFCALLLVPLGFIDHYNAGSVLAPMLGVLMAAGPLAALAGLCRAEYLNWRLRRPRAPAPAVGGALSLQLGAAVCPVCSSPVSASVVLCMKCQSPHHADCWSYAGGCSTYACGGKESSAVAEPHGP